MHKKIEEINPDIVIDFMGQGMVAQSWYNPEDWYETNISNKSKLCWGHDSARCFYTRDAILTLDDV